MAGMLSKMVGKIKSMKIGGNQVTAFGGKPMASGSGAIEKKSSRKKGDYGWRRGDAEYPLDNPGHKGGY